MLESFKNHVNTHLSFLNEGKLLIALSGGLDSVVLTHLCKTLNFEFALAHCNFKLRAEESDGDEAFVLKLAEKLNVELFVEQFDTNAHAMYHKISTQMAARALRYSWFYKLANHLSFDAILTAHHADDSLETFLINLSRGTGVDGLSGIPEVNKKIVRPLLPFSRAEILEYAKAHQLEWREDSSNTSIKYLRNALRHDVIPRLKELNPNFLDNFKRTQKHLQESVSIIEDAVDHLSKDIVEYRDDGVYIAIKKLKALKNGKAYLFQIVKDFEFSNFDDIYGLLYAQSGKYVANHLHRIVKDRDYLIISSNGSRSSNTITINEEDVQITLDIGRLSLSRTDNMSIMSKHVAFLDKDTITFPLVLRRWQKGDRFQPSGMKGSKKLSKFFKDEKLSLIDKEKIWLLCSNGNIVWVVGMRVDENFLATPNSTHILKVELH